MPIPQFCINVVIVVAFSGRWFQYRYCSFSCHFVLLNICMVFGHQNKLVGHSERLQQGPSMILGQVSLQPVLTYWAVIISHCRSRISV